MNCQRNYCVCLDQTVSHVCLFLELEMGMEGGCTKKQNTKTHTYMGLSYE